MGTSRSNTETQLRTAKETLAAYVNELKGNGVAAAQFARDPKWRNLDAKVRQINARLRKIGQVEKNNALVEQAKVERLAQRETEAVEAKAPKKAKAPKAEAAEKPQKAAKAPAAKKGK